MPRTSTIINVSDKVGTNPNYRDSADRLFTGIATTADEVVLDFKGVEFISRGFADQLHKAKLHFQAEHRTQVVLEHANEEVLAMLAAVSRTQQGRSTQQPYIPVVRIGSMKELERMLMGI